MAIEVIERSITFPASFVRQSGFYCHVIRNAKNIISLTIPCENVDTKVGKHDLKGSVAWQTTLLFNAFKTYHITKHNKLFEQRMSR